jgi:hypothetical protein
MSPLVRRGCCIALVSLLFCGRASAAEEAESLYRQALERLAAAEFEASIQLLEQARALTRSPSLLGRIHLQLGVNHEVMGKPEAARADFRAALEQDPELQADPRRLRASALQLFAEVRAGLRGDLVVACRTGAGGEVRLDGAKVGRPPWRSSLPIGGHQLEVARGRSDGGTWSEKVVVAAGKRRAVAIDCASVPKVTVAPAASRPQLPALPPKPKVSPRIKWPRRPPHLWSWVLAGGAVTAGLAAIATGLAARSDHDEWQRQGAAGTDYQRWLELRDSGRRNQLATNVLVGVTAACAVGAVTLLLLDRPWRKAERPRVHLTAGGVRGEF